MPMVRTEPGMVIARRVVVARSTAERIAGWMFRGSPEADEGLFLPGCVCVHTGFVRFAMDIVFLNADDQVLEVCSAVRPWRVLARFQANSVLELAPGRARAVGLVPGDRLVFEEEDARTASTLPPTRPGGPAVSPARHG